MNRMLTACAAALLLGGWSLPAWSQEEKPKPGDDDKYRPEGKGEDDEMTPEEAMRLLKEAQSLMLKSEELLNDSSRGKALETEEELVRKLKELLKDEEKNDSTILQKKILEKIQKLLSQSERKQQDTIDKLNDIIRRAKTTTGQSQSKPQPGQKQPNQQQQGKKSQNPTSPAPSPYDPNRTDSPSKFRSEADRTGQWGDLPARTREAMMHGSREIDKYPKEYQEMLKEEATSMSATRGLV